MDWVIALAFLGFCCWLALRVRRRSAELSATGIARSPLYWTSNALVVALLALVMYIARIHGEAPVPAFVWGGALAIIVALLVLRRALKWRYPV